MDDWSWDKIRSALDVWLSDCVGLGADSPWALEQEFRLNALDELAAEDEDKAAKAGLEVLEEYAARFHLLMAKEIHNAVLSGH